MNMRKPLVIGAAAVAFASLLLGGEPAQAAGFEVQQVESIQLLTTGTGSAVGQAYNINIANPVAANLTTPFVSVNFQNNNILDVALASAFASSLEGTSAASVFAGNNVYSVTN